MRKILKLLLTLSLACVAMASANDEIIAKTEQFFNWLDLHKREFAECKIEANTENYVLCDGMEVKKQDLKALYRLGPSELLIELKRRGIRVEVYCDANTSAAQTFYNECSKSSTRKIFKEMSGLHGQYLPQEKTILIRSSALKGSLIHEYLHFLQSENKNEIYGKVYKKTKNEIRRQLTREMDNFIATIQQLEKEKKKDQIPAHLKKFMAASTLMQNFAPWQDLIDERPLFMLYLNYGSEFGVSADDIALAKKNMGFICKNPKWSALLPAKQCQL